MGVHYERHSHEDAPITAQDPSSATANQRVSSKVAQRRRPSSANRLGAVRIPLSRSGHHG
jgi:hypothetical protein